MIKYQLKNVKRNFFLSQFTINYLRYSINNMVNKL